MDLYPNKLKTRTYFYHLSVFIVALNCCIASSQVTLNENIYIGSGGVMHLDVNDVVFKDGKVDTDRSDDYGKLSFSSEASWREADNVSYVDGFVSSYSLNSFDFPVGDENILQSLRVFDYKGALPLDVAFSYNAYQNTAVEASLNSISSKFYWEIKGGSRQAVLTLSWNAFSDVDQLVNGDLERMSIAGFDGTQWIWIESEVDSNNVFDETPSSVLSGSITSKSFVVLDSFEAFTIAYTAGDESADKILVSQGFTPNGDGMNDTWYIEKITDYPNALIKVFNKNTQEVFSAGNGYNNDWGGNFKSNKEILPDGSYFYVIDLEGDGQLIYTGWIYISR